MTAGGPAGQSGLIKAGMNFNLVILTFPETVCTLHVENVSLIETPWISKSVFTPIQIDLTNFWKFQTKFRQSLFYFFAGDRIVQINKDSFENVTRREVGRLFTIFNYLNSISLLLTIRIKNSCLNVL